MLSALPCWVLAQASPSDGSVAELRSRHAAAQAALADNAFKRPLKLVSSQSSDALKGEVDAVVDHPFPAAAPALRSRGNWCDILILHLNVKQCQPTPSGGLTVHLGKKFDQPLEDAYRVDFRFKVVAASNDYLQVRLDAEQGPLGTRDYQILLEAMPLDATKSFVHMSYSYRFGMTAKMAMQAYLATIGSDKVGFSVVGRTAQGQPEYIDGVRGVVERNTMRYYLAIEAYLDSLSAPAGQQLQRRLHDWFAATERHPRQLHEVSEKEYMEMKLKEARRQALPAP